MSKVDECGHGWEIGKLGYKDLVLPFFLEGKGGGEGLLLFSLLVCLFDFQSAFIVLQVLVFFFWNKIATISEQSAESIQKTNTIGEASVHCLPNDIIHLFLHLTETSRVCSYIIMCKDMLKLKPFVTQIQTPKCWGKLDSAGENEELVPWQFGVRWNESCIPWPWLWWTMMMMVDWLSVYPKWPKTLFDVCSSSSSWLEGMFFEMERERERKREAHTRRQTETETERQTNRVRARERDRDKDRKWQRETDRQRRVWWLGQRSQEVIMWMADRSVWVCWAPQRPGQ